VVRARETPAAARAGRPPGCPLQVGNHPVHAREFGRFHRLQGGPAAGCHHLACPCRLARRMAARESEAAADVTEQVLITARSASFAVATISCPAALKWRAMLSISAWFRRQPMVSRNIFMVYKPQNYQRPHLRPAYQAPRPPGLPRQRRNRHPSRWRSTGHSRTLLAFLRCNRSVDGLDSPPGWAGLYTIISCPSKPPGRF